MSASKTSSKLAISAFILLFVLSSATLVLGRPNPDLINLGRLSIARVSASSVNGDYGYDNPYHGVINLFDEGNGYQVDSLQYTSWYSGTGPHWVKIDFKRPVEVHSVTVITTEAPGTVQDTQRPSVPAEYAIELVQTIKEKKANLDYDSIPIRGFKTTYTLPKPVKSVTEITLTFPGLGMIELSEIKVMGLAPEGVDTTEQVPAGLLKIDPKKSNHSVNITRNTEDEQELRVLKLVEQAVCLRSDLAQAAIHAHNETFDNEYVEGQWWYAKVNNIRVPYSITADAIDYFASLVKGYASEYKNSAKPRISKFTYQADIRKTNKALRDKDAPPSKSIVFREGYAIKMQMSFMSCIETGKGIGFSKEKDVFTDMDGKILSVSGDGATRLLLE